MTAKSDMGWCDHSDLFIIVVMPPLTPTTTPDNDVVVAASPDIPHQRVVLDRIQRTVTFENCHLPRSGLGLGCEQRRVCQFEEIVAARDFLIGEHRGRVLRLIFLLGRLIHIPTNANEQGALWISTQFGRARVFANWSQFAELRSLLREICSQQSTKGHWEDDPRMIPVFVVLIFAIVGGIIWCCL